MIIAEISGNHNGDLSRAKALIFAAKQAGADAVKFQTYTADTITLDSYRPEFMLKGGLWDGKRLYDLYQWASTPWEWHQELFEYARSFDLLAFSSPFDETAIDFLETLNCPIYKIASFEAMDLPLIRKAAATGKPLIISTGVINAEQIQEALDTVYATGNRLVTLLHCVSQYPANPEDYNLNTIIDLKQRFGVPLGLSDHTLDNKVAIAATALGVEVIEKHITLSRADGGPDAGFSLEPNEFKFLVDACHIVRKAMGTVSYANTDKANCYRSLYVTKPIKKGEPFTKENVRSVRPGLGLEPKYIDQILGRVASQDIDFSSPMQWSFVVKD
jgi:pseudaminic acid synthase